MKPLRIVLALPEPPLPFGGAAARWYYVLLRGLVERGHIVTTIAACSDAAQADAVVGVFPSPRFSIKCHRIASCGGLVGKLRSFRRPFNYLFSPSYRANLAESLDAGYDILHLEQLWTGTLGLQHPKRCITNVHYLYSIDWSGQRGGSMREVLLRYSALRAERALLHRLRNFITLTPRLTDAIARVNPAARVTTVPMALDLSLYPFHTDGPQGIAGARPPTLGLVGSFNWTPSFMAGKRLITQLWPQVLQRVPDARLRIVGRSARTAFAHLDLPRTEIYQDVPDTRPHFEAIDVLLYAPNMGSGLKVKIMEAFAFGTPVVTNSEGAEGMPIIDGKHAGIDNSDAGLVDRAVRLLQDANLRQSQRMAARRMLESLCDPEQAIDRLLSAYAYAFDL